MVGCRGCSFICGRLLVKQIIERNRVLRELSALTIDLFSNHKHKQIYLPSGNQRPAVLPRCQPYLFYLLVV